MAGREEFGESGRGLWDDLHDVSDSVAITALVVEACRVVDRLDVLAVASSRDGIVSLLDRAEKGVTEVRVDAALSESRQQANVLRLLLAEIARRKDGVTVVGSDDLADL